MSTECKSLSQSPIRLRNRTASSSKSTSSELSFASSSDSKSTKITVVDKLNESFFGADSDCTFPSSFNPEHSSGETESLPWIREKVSVENWPGERQSLSKPVV